jgi:hypothetical protein
MKTPAEMLTIYRDWASALPEGHPKKWIGWWDDEIVIYLMQKYHEQFITKSDDRKTPQ